MPRKQSPGGRRGKRARGRGAREANRLFQIDPYWLGYEAGSDAIYYYWHDGKSGRTRRKTTGERDLEAAKLWLMKHVMARPPDEPQHPDKVAWVTVRRHYLTEHADAIRSRDVARNAFKHLRIYMAKIAAETGIEGAPCVGWFTLARQEGFMRWCRDTHGHSAKTISTYLAYIKAAVAFAAKPRLVRDAEGERETRVLSQAPYIEAGEKTVAKITGLPRSKPREWIPTDAQLAAIIDGIPDDAEHEPLFRYIIMALNTWARPEAIFELSVKDQVDFASGIVALNPRGRPQNNKVRPDVLLTDNLRGWLTHWNLDYPLVYFGRRVMTIHLRTLRKAAVAGGVDPAPVNFYMLRHYMATRVRRVDGIPVTREERAKWLGHKDAGNSMTEWYESFDAEYLRNAALATDAIMRRLDHLTRRALWSPASAPFGAENAGFSQPAPKDRQKSQRNQDIRNGA